MIEKKRRLCFVFDDYIDNAILDFCYKKLISVRQLFLRSWLTAACYHMCKKKGKIGIAAIRSLKNAGVKIDDDKIVRIKTF